jgi:hypothetical protein
MNNKVKSDVEKLSSGCSQNISLVAKWVPRERSYKFGWLYEDLAMNYFSEYGKSCKTEEAYQRAIKKSKMDYRKCVSLLNQQIDTLQVKQCKKEWEKIQFTHVTSCSLVKQKKAFLNIRKDGTSRTILKDRFLCADHFREYIQEEEKEGSDMKGRRISLNEFTKQAMELIRQPLNRDKEEYSLQVELLNSQWRNHSFQNVSLGNVIPMIDMSECMEGEPMNAAISLGILLAEKSMLGRRVLTFSNQPKWINLEECEGFVDSVQKIMREADKGTNGNFYGALDLLLEAMVEVKISAEHVQDVMLVIFSGMQMDKNMGERDPLLLYDQIKKKYEETGRRICGKPYKPPHILFWNLRTMNSFPILSNQPNCSMMSGFHSSLLNLFCEQGRRAFQACTPWSLLMKSLEKERYKRMEKKFNQIFII